MATKGDESKKEEDDSSISESEDVSSNEWNGRILKSRPEILQFIERSRGITDITSSGRKLGSPSTENPHILSHSAVTQLILQYLNERGYKKAVEKIEFETSFKLQKMNDNVLEKILHGGIDDVASLFDPALSSLDDEGVVDKEVTWFDYQPSNFFQETLYEEDTNIWNTQKDKDIKIEEVDKKTSVVEAASFNALVHFITSSHPAFMGTRNVFLTTYRSFTTPDKLFDKFVEKYTVPEDVMDDVQYVKQLRMRVVLALKHWVGAHPRDFSDQLLVKLRNFIDDRLIADGYQELARTLSNSLSKLKEAHAYRIEGDLCPAPLVPKNLFSLHLKELNMMGEGNDNINKLEIARQITLLDYNIFSLISPIEFCNKNWTKTTTNVRNSMLLAMIQRYNNMVKWVMTSILSEKKYKARAKIIQNFLEVATNLHQVQNFNGMAAIYSALTHHSIYRLKHTFNSLSPQARRIMSNIAEFLSPVDNYKNYISAIHQLKPPLIPFLAVHLHELTTIEEIMEETIFVPEFQKNLINFRKHRMISKVISEISRFQSIGYNFFPIRQLSVLLSFSNVKKKDENEFYKLSLILEPKGITAIDLVDYEATLK